MGRKLGAALILNKECKLMLFSHKEKIYQKK